MYRDIHHSGSHIHIQSKAQGCGPAILQMLNSTHVGKTFLGAQISQETQSLWQCDRLSGEAQPLRWVLRAASSWGKVLLIKGMPQADTCCSTRLKMMVVPSLNLFFCNTGDSVRDTQRRLECPHAAGGRTPSSPPDCSQKGVGGSQLSSALLSCCQPGSLPEIYTLAEPRSQTAG